MSFYDRIANRWDGITGEAGGAFKRHVLNDYLLGLIADIRGKAILELGAGNGYFGRLLMERLGSPLSLCLTDASSSLLDIARRRHYARGADYRVLDAGERFPFEAGSFDLILSTMVLNELPTPVLRNAILESRRVLKTGGCLIATLLHPRFIEGLARRGQLRPARDGRGPLTMPGAKGLRLPVVPRSLKEYEAILSGSDLSFERYEVHATEKVLKEKRGAAASRKIPWAVCYRCSAVKDGAGRNGQPQGEAFISPPASGSPVQGPEARSS